jgi:uncharacterized protein (DUF433 family)
MAIQGEEPIATDPDVLGGKPRVAGMRFGVHFIARRVEEGSDDSKTLADEFDLALGNVSLALAYSHTHPDEMRAIEARRRAAYEEAGRLTPEDV